MTGDIVYLNIFGQPMIVLGTHEAAVDLLEKRSANYSSRHLTLVAQMSVLFIAIVAIAPFVLTGPVGQASSGYSR